MDTVFCTLFDSNYLDKGLVLYDSMNKYMQCFRLYVFAFDIRCYNILLKEKKDNLIPIPLSDLERKYPCLLEAKKNRSATEYNWTCSAWSIKYVLEQFNECICTYIDADMRFFSSPEIVFQTMREQGCSIIIVPHRFHSDSFEEKEGPKTGYYCVEFNTFLSDNNGLEALNWWAEQCQKWCYYTVPSIEKWYGDQKYLNDFPKRFKGVYSGDHFGVGLGPWNDNRMELESGNDTIKVKDKKSKKVYSLVIYHFAGVSYLSEHIIRVSSRMKDKRLHKLVFNQYINELLEKREYLIRKYDFVFNKAKRIETRNVILRIYHKYIMPIIKIRHIYNLYFVDK